MPKHVSNSSHQETQRQLNECDVEHISTSLYLYLSLSSEFEYSRTSKTGTPWGCYRICTIDIVYRAIRKNHPPHASYISEDSQQFLPEQKLLCRDSLIVTYLITR
jgi:hypothetical protein